MECEAHMRYSVFRRPQYAPRPSESRFGGIGAFVQATARCGWILRRVGLYADRADVSLWQTFRPAVYAFVRQPCGLFAPHGLIRRLNVFSDGLGLWRPSENFGVSGLSGRRYAAVFRVPIRRLHRSFSTRCRFRDAEAVGNPAGRFPKPPGRLPVPPSRPAVLVRRPNFGRRCRSCARPAMRPVRQMRDVRDRAACRSCSAGR